MPIDEIVIKALALARSVLADEIDRAYSIGSKPDQRTVLAESALQAAIVHAGGLKADQEFSGQRLIEEAPSLLEHLQTLVAAVDEQLPTSEILNYIHIECRYVVHKVVGQPS